MCLFSLSVDFVLFLCFMENVKRWCKQCPAGWHVQGIVTQTVTNWKDASRPVWHYIQGVQRSHNSSRCLLPVFLKHRVLIWTLAFLLIRGFLLDFFLHYGNLQLLCATNQQGFVKSNLLKWELRYITCIHFKHPFIECSRDMHSTALETNENPFNWSMVSKWWRNICESHGRIILQNVVLWTVSHHNNISIFIKYLPVI